MPLTIDLAVEHEAWGTHEVFPGDLDALIERAVHAALAEVARAGAPSPAEGAELSIVLGDDTFIRTLNRQWLGKDKATNVLSFPAAEAARSFTLGDIVVAYETTAREAVERGTPLADHLAHLIIHGLFHLLGFDHDSEPVAQRMEALESRALATLGMASPYDEALVKDALEDAAHLRGTR